MMWVLVFLKSILSPEKNLQLVNCVEKKRITPYNMLYILQKAFTLITTFINTIIFIPST